jgi:hypothetical protein
MEIQNVTKDTFQVHFRKEEFEDTKEKIRIRISTKNRQHKGETTINKDYK